MVALMYKLVKHVQLVKMKTGDFRHLPVFIVLRMASHLN